MAKNQVSPGHPGGGYDPNKNKPTKSHWSGNGGNGNGNKTVTKTTNTTNDKDGGKFVPFTLKAAKFVIDKTIGPWADKHNEKKRTDYARKQGLYRDYYRANQHNKEPKSRTLDVMSDTGKDYLKEAGYGPFQDKKPTTGGDGQQRCPDGTMPPCPPVATGTTAAAPTPTTTPSTNWQLYPENSNYITGQGYDEGGGVRKGPPPKRGPNPQVPPLKFSRGGGCAVRGTKFKGVR